MRRKKAAFPICLPCAHPLKGAHSIIHPRASGGYTRQDRLIQKHTSKSSWGIYLQKLLNIFRLEAGVRNKKLQCFYNSIPLPGPNFSSAHCMNVRSVIE